MEKIIRLSLANIRKHKLETAALFLLVTLCVTLLGASLSAAAGIRTIFPQIMEHTRSYENFVLIQEKNYDSEFQHILEQTEQVEDVQTAELLYSLSTNYLDRQGKEQALYLSFITRDNNDKIQRTEIDTTLTDAEIAAIAHPIYMPYTVHDAMGYQVNEAFDVIVGTKKFSFTIAGFYDTLLFDQVSGGLKMIVSDADYHILSTVIPNYIALAYNDHNGQGGEQMFYDFLDACEDYSNLDIKSGIYAIIYQGIESSITYAANTVMAIMAAMAIVIILAVAVMIRFRITTDMREQLVSIGVLEALGYTSMEITLSYVIEYVLIAGAGVVLGILSAFVMSPAMFKAGEMITEHRGTAGTAVLPILLAGLAVLVFVAGIAFFRARIVRKYPPVIAFRKGQGDHRFTKAHFPLDQTRQNVHIRLAMKGFLENWRQNVGLMVCIMVTTLASVFSFVMFSFFSGDMNAIAATAGMEMSDLRLEVMPSVDTVQFCEELVAMPEIRKATPTAGTDCMITVSDYNETMFPIVFSSFDVTENIFPASGRFPEHDNEIMVTNMFARHYHVKLGDTLTLEYLKVQKPYLITGFVTSSTNGGINLYLTEDGMKRIMPTYRPNTIEVYLEEGIDANAFRYTLTERYGRSLSDTAQETAVTGSYEERIRAEAEQQIAEMLANYGVSHVEYAIQSGDTVITGDSSQFCIASIMNIRDIMRTQLSATSTAIQMIATLFMVLSGIVVMVILFVLMESTIRRQRKELGIMKGIGYTSRELMMQLALRMMPTAWTAVLLGTVLGVSATNLLTNYIGKVQVNLLLVIVLDLLMIAYCFGCAYLGARKIRKISVYELMTE